MRLRGPLLNVILQRPHVHTTPTDSSWLYTSNHSQNPSYPKPKPDTLLRLITQNQFGAAERVLHSIIDAGQTHEITPHPAFERAALSALQWDDDPHRCLQQFTTWFNFFPHMYHQNSVLSLRILQDQDQDRSTDDSGIMSVSKKQPLRATVDMLFRAGRPTSNLPLIREFALICASKGYIRYVQDHVLHLFAAQPISTAELVGFLEEMEKAAVEYERTYSVRDCARALAEQLRVTAVEHLCRSGRHEGVKKVLVRHASDQETVLPDGIYDRAIKKLREESTESSSVGRRMAQRIKVLNKLREVEASKRASSSSSPPPPPPCRPREQQQVINVQLPGTPSW